MRVCVCVCIRACACACVRARMCVCVCTVCALESDESMAASYRCSCAKGKARHPPSSTQLLPPFQGTAGERVEGRKGAIKEGESLRIPGL